MNYDEFLAAANQACKVVLDALGQRLPKHEPHDLAGQLPPELQDPLLAHTGAAETSDDLDDFLRRVADREGLGCSSDEALGHARAVLGTMATFVSAGEIQDLRSQLPAGYSPCSNNPPDPADASGLRPKVVGVQPATVTVPDVVGFDATDACEMVRAAGLVPYGPGFEPAPTSGTVLDQEPVADTDAEYAAAVTVWPQGRDTADELVAPTPEGAENPEPT